MVLSLPRNDYHNSIGGKLREDKQLTEVNRDGRRNASNLEEWTEKSVSNDEWRRTVAQK
jgi:hypothetical protein